MQTNPAIEQSKNI